MKYALEHPYITAVIIFVILIVIDNAIKSIAAVRIARYNSKEVKTDEHRTNSH